VQTGKHRCGTASRLGGGPNKIPGLGQDDGLVCEVYKGGLSSSKCRVHRGGVVTLDGVYSRDGGNLPSLMENVSLRRSEGDELVDSKISVPYLLAARQRHAFIGGTAATHFGGAGHGWLRTDSPILVSAICSH
jgi:hypothetical protein